MNGEEILISKFFEIKEKGWILTKRHGDQCLGNTFEDLIGKKEDNKSKADFYDIELKTHRISTSSLVSLFSKSPSYPKGVNTYLRENYGVVDETGFGKKVLNTTVNGLKENSHRGGFSFKAIVDRKEEKIFLEIKNILSEEISKNDVYWNFSDINNALKNKIKTIAILYGEEKDENENHFVRYNEMKIIKNISLETFLEGIEKGKVFIDIRIGVYASGKNIGKTHDHGTGFRIFEKDLIELYSERKEYK